MLASYTILNALTSSQKYQEVQELRGIHQNAQLREKIKSRNSFCCISTNENREIISYHESCCRANACLPPNHLQDLNGIVRDTMDDAIVKRIFKRPKVQGPRIDSIPKMQGA